MSWLLEVLKKKNPISKTVDKLSTHLLSQNIENINHIRAHNQQKNNSNYVNESSMFHLMWISLNPTIKYSFKTIKNQLEFRNVIDSRLCSVI